MIPDASRAILKQWQAQGLKFNWLESPDKNPLGFDGEIEDYEIVEQPIPEGVTVEQAQAMWEQGLRVEFDEPYGGQGWTEIRDTFTWSGNRATFKGAELLKRLRIPAQPIPEKLLQEPVTELPAEKCVIGQESDPNGLDPHAPGAKLDAGKNRLDLVLGGFANALEAVGLVGTYGAEKYTPNGWKEVPDGVARYEDAMMRHWIEVKKGNAIDSTTMLSHRAQLIWNALAALELLSTWEG